MTKDKRLDIELMRILAAFFVIFNHTDTTGFFLFSLYDPHSIQYWLYLFISIFCKLSVPLFFMISGALLLDRQPEPIKTVWLRRVLHMVGVIAVWSFFYYMVSVCQGRGAFDFSNFLMQLYEENWNFSYWYLYVYISFLLSLPLLQRIAQNLLNKDYFYMITLYIVFVMILPSIQYLFWQGEHRLNGNISVGWLISDIVIFPLAGYFLDHRIRDFWNGKRIAVLWLVNIATILFACYLTYDLAKVTGVCNEIESQVFHKTFVLINAATVFVTFQYLSEHLKMIRKMRKVITSVGGCTFGIYLLHVYLKDYTELSAYIGKVQERLLISPMIYAFIYCAIIFGCGYLITLVLKRIPVVKRLVT